MKRRYPVIDIAGTGQNIKRIMQLKGLTVKAIQEFLALSTPQSIYHWFDGRNLPALDNLYALSELFQLPVDALLIGNRTFTGGLQLECELPAESLRHKDIERRMFVYYKKITKLKAG